MSAINQTQNQMTLKIIKRAVLTFIDKIAVENNLSRCTCANIAKEHLENTDIIVQPHKPVILTRSKYTTRKRIVYSDCKCKARVWSDDGNKQCSYNAIAGNEFCKRHLRQYEECPEPCNFEEGITLGTSDIKRKYRKGLFLGRIDEPLEKAIVCKNNIIRIHWSDNKEAFKLMINKVCSGEWEYQNNEGNKQKTWKKRSIEEWKRYMQHCYIAKFLYEAGKRVNTGPDGWPIEDDLQSVAL